MEKAAPPDENPPKNAWARARSHPALERVRAKTKAWADVIAHPATWAKVHLYAQKAAHPKIWTRVGVIVGALVAALIFFVAGVALRLLMGPISLGPFADTIEDSVNRSLSGLIVRFDRAALEWSTEDGKINLIIEGTRLFDPNGHIIAQAPQADLDFDQMSLLEGKPVLTRFALTGIQLTAVRTQQGALKLGFTPEDRESDLLEAIRKTLAHNQQSGSSLDHFEIIDARLAYRDEPTGLFLVSPSANLTVTNRQGRVFAALKALVEISGSRAELVASAELRDDGTPRSGRLEVRQLNLAALARNSRSFGFLKPFEIATDFSANFTLDGEGGLITTEFMAQGSGMVGPPLWHSDEFHVGNARIHGTYSGATSKVVLDQISATGERFHGHGHATVDLVWQDHRVTGIAVSTALNDIFLDAPSTFTPPLALDKIAVDATYDREARLITWRQAAVSGGPLALSFTGTTQLAGNAAPAIQIEGTAGAIGVRDLLRFWPKNVGDGARRWIDENVPQGLLGPFRIVANMAAGALDETRLPEDALHVSFPVQDGSAHYMKGLTMLTNIRGEGVLTGDTFNATFTQGNIGPLRLLGGTGHIPDLHIPGPTGEFKAHIVGRMADLLMLINQKPLEYATRFHVDPATTKGDADLSLDFRLPMLDKLDVSQVNLGVNAKVSGLVFPIDEKRQIEAGEASFMIDGKSLTSEGTANLAGVPVRFKWTEDFAPVARTTRIDLEGMLDDASRARLGLSEPTWLTGPVRVSGQLYGHRFQFNGATIRADISAASLRIPNTSIEKAAGAPASLSATVVFDGKRSTTISNISLAGTTMSASGNITINEAGDIVSASLPVIRAGPNNDFGVTITQLASGVTAYRIEGRSLDASRLLARSKPTTPAPETDPSTRRPFNVEARLAQVTLRDSLNLRDVSLSLTFAVADRLTGFSLDAAGPAKGRLTGRFAMTGGARTAWIQTDDGGTLIRGLTGFASIRGGSAALHVAFPNDVAPTYDYRGTVSLRNITVMNQPFIARLFAIGSLEGPLRLLQGEGIPISKFEAPFTSQGKMLTITDGRASGSAVGFTFAGSVDRGHDRLDLKGTLVPVYGLNSIISGVPVLGPLLTSREGEGIIGLTYAVRGDLDKPEISVNPLSLVTPGILRRIFEYGAAPVPRTPTAPTPNATPVPTAPSAPAGVPPRPPVQTQTLPAPAATPPVQGGH